MKKLLAYLVIAVVLGGVCGYLLNYLSYMGVEENFMYWAVEDAK